MLRIWGRLSSINVQKVVWAADELGIAYERRDAGGAFGIVSTAEYRRMNPNGLVPVIEDDGFVLWESNAIVRYLAARFRSGVLRPKDHRGLAMAEQWMEWQQQSFAPHVVTLFVNTVRSLPENRNPAAVAMAEKQAAQAIVIADQWLARHDWFAGTAFSFGDIAMGALLWRYMGLEISKPDMPNLRGWLSALERREPFRNTVMAVPRAKSLDDWQRIERETA